MKDRNGGVVEDYWERDREILRKMITGKIKLLVVGKKGELERETRKYQEIEMSFKGESRDRGINENKWIY